MDVPALLYHAAERNDHSLVRQLLDNGADPNECYQDVVNISSRSILHVCCRKGSLECARLLVDAGADVLARDKYRMTPLIYAIICQHCKVVDTLLSACKEAVNAADRNSKTPLHFAVESDCTETVNTLLKHGANVNQRSVHGTSPFMTLVTTPNLQNRLAIAELLVKARADLDLKDTHSERGALHFAVMRRDVQMSETMIKAGADINIVDVMGKTPITTLICDHVRIHRLNDDIDNVTKRLILMLLQAGADIDFVKSEDGNPLMVATKLKSLKLMEFLLYHGADPDIQFSSGRTPLLLSVHEQYLPGAEVLVTYNAKMDLEGSVGWDSSDGTMETRRVHGRGLLQERGEVTDVMQLAIKTKQWDFVRLFISFGYQVKKLRHVLSSDTSSEPPTNLDAIKHIQEYVTEPISLYMSTVFFIRKLLGKGLHLKVAHLSLPPRIQKVIFSSACELVDMYMYSFDKQIVQH